MKARLLHAMICGLGTCLVSSAAALAQGSPANTADIFNQYKVSFIAEAANSKSKRSCQSPLLSDPANTIAFHSMLIAETQLNAMLSEEDKVKLDAWESDMRSKIESADCVDLRSAQMIDSAIRTIRAETDISLLIWSNSGLTSCSWLDNTDFETIKELSDGVEARANAISADLFEVLNNKAKDRLTLDQVVAACASNFQTGNLEGKPYWEMAKTIAISN